MTNYPFNHSGNIQNDAANNRQYPSVNSEQGQPSFQNTQSQQSAPQNAQPQFPIISFSLPQWDTLSILPTGYPLPFPFKSQPQSSPFTHWINNTSPAQSFIYGFKTINVQSSNDVNINPHEPLNGAIHHKMKAGESISEALTADIFSYPAALSSPISTLPRSLPAALINASTGYGKTTFAINTLRQKAFSDGYYVLLIVNRSILKNQVKRLVDQGLNQYNIGTDADPISICGNVVITTYQHFMSGYDKLYAELTKLPIISNNTQLEIKHIGYIVMDEVHYFLSDASFGGNTAEALRNIIRFSYWPYDSNLYSRYCYMAFPKLYPQIKRIYMTATPKYVKDVIKYEERCAAVIRNALEEAYNLSVNPEIYKTVRPSIVPLFIDEYDFPHKKQSIGVNVYFSNSYIKTKIINSDNSERWLVFVQSIDEGKELCKELCRKNVDAVFLSSAEENSRERKTLEVYQRFDCRVLVATSVLDNGINIIDDELKNIVIDSTDEIQLLQMLGRKRIADGEHVNLFIKNKTAENLTDYCDYCEKIISSLVASLGEVESFENMLNDDDFCGREFFKYNAFFHRHLPADYSLHYMKIKSDDLIKLRSDLIRDKDAFAKKVCGWIGIQFDPSMIVKDDNPLTDYWEKVEKVIFDTALDRLTQIEDGDDAKSAESLKELVKKAPKKKLFTQKSLDSVKSQLGNIIAPIKRGSGIIMGDSSSVTECINSVFTYFASKGFDLYKFGGQEPYFLSLVQEAEKR